MKIPQLIWDLSFTYSQLSDEFVSVQVVLRLSDCTEAILKHHLPRLEARLDVFAIDPAESAAENPTPTREVIFSGIVDTTKEPLVVFNEFEGDEGAGNHVYLIWNTETFLSTLDECMLVTSLTNIKSALEIVFNTHRFCSWHRRA